MRPFVAAAALLAALACDGGGNTPPDAPLKPAGPGAGFPNHPYTFAAVTADPDSDSVSYRFDWGDGTLSDWTAYVASGETGYAEHGWSVAGSFRVRCRARDANAWSDWSEEAGFTAAGEGTLAAELDLGSEVLFSPVRFGTGIVFATSAGELVLVDDTLGIRARINLGAAANGTPASSGDSLLFAVLDNSRLYALDADLDTAWGKLVGFNCTAPAIGPGGRVFVGATDGRMRVYGPDGRSGGVFQAAAAIRSPVAVTADTVAIFGCEDGSVYAVNPDLSERWRFATGDAVDASPALGADGTVYAGSRDNRLYAIAADGTKRWEYATTGDVRGAPCLGPDGSVYFGSDDRKLHRLDAAGSAVWEYESDGLVRSGPTCADNGRVYFGTNDGRVNAVDADGELVWSVECAGAVNGAVLIGDDGTVYCAGGSSVYAIAGSGGLADSDWPTYRHDPRRTGRGE